MPKLISSKRDSTKKRNILSHKIIEKIMGNPKIGKMKLQSVRDSISRIHKKNPGVSINGAAHIFAESKGISIYRYLKPEDVTSLQYKTQNILQNKQPISNKSKKKFISRTELESPYLSEAISNAESYPSAYVLENTLRSVIIEKFGKDKDWWHNSKIVLTGIQDYAKKIEEAEKKYPFMNPRENHPIYYVGLLELFKIIEMNWSTFKKTFRDLEQLKAWIKESVPIRNMIAHNIKLKKLYKQRIEQNTDFICTLIKNSKNKGV
jgi:hypothetical protein